MNKFLKHASIFAVFAFLGWLSIGCSQAQVAPTSFQANLSWTAPSGCTTGCTYVASRITLASGTTSCPAANVATPNYTPLNSASPATGTTFTDATAAGLTVCYIAQTEQGGAVSVPSNVVGPLVVPAGPLAPTLSGNEAVAEMDMSDPGAFAITFGDKVNGLAAITAPTLTATLVPSR